MDHKGLAPASGAPAPSDDVALRLPARQALRRDFATAALDNADPLFRADLEQRWLRLTRTTLPALATERGWPISADHCFQRVLLDNAVGGCWYDHIAKRPAYRHAPDAILMRAVDLAQSASAGDQDMANLDRKSLAWRGKRVR